MTTMSQQDCWEFWIDVGGTFTDCLAVNPRGSYHRAKVLSSGVLRSTGNWLASNSASRVFIDVRRASDPPNFWRGYEFRWIHGAHSSPWCTTVTASQGTRLTLAASPPQDIIERQGTEGDSASQLWTYELTADEESPIFAIRQILGQRLDESLPPVRLRLGTTRGTNALLTRTGARTAVVTTAGFADLTSIGDQDRPELFALNIHKRRPLAEKVVEVTERIGADGKILQPLFSPAAREVLEALRHEGIESLAICLLNAYANPEHEEDLERIAQEVGFREISISSQLQPLMGLVSRLDTTQLDAYLNPLLRRYLQKIEQRLGPGSELRVMTSAGGLTLAEHFRGADSILSGPAGGIVGVAQVASSLGFRQAIGFDMGGTSTDVARYDDGFELEYEQIKAGIRVGAPLLAIETVAAGGGSICGFDGVKLFVGPQSAGADPGPASYGKGGPLTVTDLNVYLGRIPAEYFPVPLDRIAVASRLDELLAQLPPSDPAVAAEEARCALAAGLIRIANHNMAQAIRSVSVAKGRDPRREVLVGFGGAGGQHVCAVAAELGMQRILLHPDAGILSALGIGLADTVRHRAQAIYARWNDISRSDRQQQLAQLTHQVSADLMSEGFAEHEIRIAHQAELRCTGHDATLLVTLHDPESAVEQFWLAYERLYGYREVERDLEVVAWRVSGTANRSTHDIHSIAASTSSASIAESARREPTGSPRRQPLFFAGEHLSAEVYTRAELSSGEVIPGPAIICEATSTTVVDPGWQAELLSGGVLQLTPHAQNNRRDTSLEGTANEIQRSKALPGNAVAVDPVMLEIFNQHFAAIARQMGLTLQRTARSVNVKQRLDFSCAIFTAAGELVVNAPHIPVHLGAMSETVRCVLEDNRELSPGDVIVTNDPFRGGSHLPDITVITPIHDPQSGDLLFFTASRAHHAEIGGKTPGSMPPDARSLAEEGVVLSNFRLLDHGQPNWETLVRLLTSGAYPSRNPSDNVADLRAQVAANQQGAQQLLAMIEKYSWPVVRAYMRHIQQAAEYQTRRAIERLPAGRHEFTDYLDHGAKIQVTLTIAEPHSEFTHPITVDFTGTDGVQPNNLNANRAIAVAAVLYVLRCMIDDPIPLNQGVLAPVRLILPTCLLNPLAGASPAESPAVAAGNVETSQRVVDVLLGALQLSAASQGTMNNVLFGNDTFGYYETICGGAGATSTEPGADAVHTHMTNTRLTDPEVLEARYPVRLREFSIRRNSGGRGTQRGGDGVNREFEFLVPLRLSLITQRRGPYSPYGMLGGEAGAQGRNVLVRSDGTHEMLPSLASCDIEPGDRLRIETPGGGGFGPHG